MILHQIGLLVLSIILVIIIIRKKRLKLLGEDAKTNHLWLYSLLIILSGAIMFWINQSFIYDLITPLIPAEVISGMIKTNILYSLSYLGIVILTIIGIAYLRRIKPRQSIGNKIKQFGNSEKQDLV